MITVRLLTKDYSTLAKCLVPINEEQMAMSMPERERFLKKHTLPFTEEEITAKFGTSSVAISK